MKRIAFINIFLIGLAALLVSGIFASCKKDKLLTDPGAKLSFSTDTVHFDTVFSVLGGGPFPRSANMRFLVYNPHTEKIRTNIRLGRGQASPFRINIDGKPSLSVDNYEIAGKDSIYIFVEVSIDPRNLNNPYIEHDSVVFETNGNTQDIKLVAYGQDAYYFNSVQTTNDTAWLDANKPYVIYDFFYVSPNRKLTIGPGVKVYSDVNAYLLVSGTLEVNGNKDNRVSFKGARLGKDYEDLPGQWGGIWMLTDSRDCKIKFADIKNATIGIRCDSLSNNANPKIALENTLVQNMSVAGVLGVTAKIKLTNCCVANCGKYTFASQFGGDYDFSYCTFANFNTTFTRKDESFGFSDNYKDDKGVIHVSPVNFKVINSIIYSSVKDEIIISEQGPNTVNGTFESCILKTQLQASLPKYFGTNIIVKDPKFKDINQFDFSLDTLSPAKNNAIAPFVPDDLKGTPRSDGQPDIGAYERVE